MRLYIEQKIFSFRDRFSVKDEDGYDKYFVEGELFSFGKKLHIFDRNDVEIGMIHQKVMSFLPKFYVYVGGMEVAEIVKEFTFFKPKYSIDGLGWSVDGDFWSHDYIIRDNGREIISIHKTWMTWGDCYELDIDQDADEIVALAVVLAIDCVMDVNNSAGSSN